MVAWFEQNLHKVICLEYAPSPKPGSLSMNPCVPVFNSSSSSTVYVSRKACFFARVASQLLKQERKIREIHSGSVLPPKDGQNLRQSGEPPKKTEEYLWTLWTTGLRSNRSRVPQSNRLASKLWEERSNFWPIPRWLQLQFLRRPGTAGHGHSKKRTGALCRLKTQM